MSPQWAEVAGYTLWLYFSEPHERPHVAVRHGSRRVATVDITTGEVLAGYLPPKARRQVRDLVSANRAALLVAFERTLRHEFPGRLDDRKEDRDE